MTVAIPQVKGLLPCCPSLFLHERKSMKILQQRKCKVNMRKCFLTVLREFNNLHRQAVKILENQLNKQVWDCGALFDPLQTKESDCLCPGNCRCWRSAEPAVPVGGRAMGGPEWNEALEGGHWRKKDKSGWLFTYWCDWRYQWFLQPGAGFLPSDDWEHPALLTYAWNNSQAGRKSESLGMLLLPLHPGDFLDDLAKPLPALSFYLPIIGALSIKVVECHRN